MHGIQARLELFVFRSERRYPVNHPRKTTTFNHERVQLLCMKKLHVLEDSWHSYLALISRVTSMFRLRLDTKTQIAGLLFLVLKHMEAIWRQWTRWKHGKLSVKHNLSWYFRPLQSLLLLHQADAALQTVHVLFKVGLHVNKKIVSAACVCMSFNTSILAEYTKQNHFCIFTEAKWPKWSLCKVTPQNWFFAHLTTACYFILR